MREKWNKTESPKNDDGQPVVQRIHMFNQEPMYKPKLLKKTPSTRAITNYNNLSIEEDGSRNTYENLSFIPESDNNVDAYMKACNEQPSTDIPYGNGHVSNGITYPNNEYDPYDYATLGSSSIKTNISYNGSEMELERTDLGGSSTKLVSSKVGMSCGTWFGHLQTIICTISLAAGFGNIYRLPQTTLVRGGLPFLVAYVILTLLVGLPLIFLELGIGQLAQEGFIKSWRAVPFFKGVGYVKLLVGCLLSLYYPLYISLSLYYIIWTSISSLPFEDCAVVKIKKTGYQTEGLNGQQCLKKTFLVSPLVDPTWYGIFAGLLFATWIIITILSIRRTKSFIRSLSLLLFPMVGLMIALTVKAVLVEEAFGSLEKLNKEMDWSILKNGYVWYYAAIQVFFSTNIGFGTFVTNAGIIYNKVNPFWTALGYILVNLLFGIGSVAIYCILSEELDTISPGKGDITELHLLSLIYTVMIKSDQVTAKVWAIVVFVFILISGLISMATITYTLLKAITVQHRNRLKWWQTSVILSFTSFVLGCALLLKSDFQLIRLLDYYLVGNLILLSVIIEVFALIAFYGTERIKSDFEFMLGHILSNFWLILWWFLPLLLTGIFAWGLITLPMNDGFVEDPLWLNVTGWSLVLAAALLILVIGYHTATKQDGYTLKDRVKTSLKPSNNWGPKDPMLRHTWIQWNSKAKQGERDFTLKRKGTRDYTRSIKKNARKAAADATINGTLKSDHGRPISDQNQNVRLSNASSCDYIEPFYRTSDVLNGSRPAENKLKLTSLIDSMHSSSSYVNLAHNANGRTHQKNPLARQYTNEFDEDGFGSYSRKGPYVIPERGNIIHVCHRRFSDDSEIATEL